MPTAAELRTFLLGAAGDTDDAVLDEVIRQATVEVESDGVDSSSDTYKDLVLYKSRILFYENGLNAGGADTVSSEQIADIKISYGNNSIQDIQKKLDGFCTAYIKLLKTVIGMTHRLV